MSNKDSNTTGLTSPIFQERVNYKPFQFPWAYDLWKTQMQMHWMADDVPSWKEDIDDWKHKLSSDEKELLTQILTFFTQGDVDVAGGYTKKYMPLFYHPELIMMMSIFASTECFDKETELLTSEGWKNVSKITEKDLLADYNQTTQQISFNKADKIVKTPYKGIMHHYLSETTDICVTPNHNLILMHPSTRKVEKKKSEQGKWGRNYLYPRAGFVENESRVSEEELDKLRLLIAIAADGCLRGLTPQGNIEHRTCDIHLYKKRKIERLQSLLIKNGIKKEPIEKGDGSKTFTFLVPESINLIEIKDLSFIKLAELNLYDLTELAHEIIFWDGSIQENTKQRYFYSTNKNAIDKFQAICVLSGLSSHISVNKLKGSVSTLNNKTIKSTKDCFVVSSGSSFWKTYPHRIKKDYDDFVYCVSVPNQNIVSRRNDKVAITGNSNHIDAYSKLIETLGFPESTYSKFLEYKDMADKHNYLWDSQDLGDPVKNIAFDIAKFSAFSEGLQLYSSFAILKSFELVNKMKGMAQIVTWSVK